MPKILFVCSANMCRSPMAQVLFERLLRQHGIQDEWEVGSAATWGFDGSRATEGAIQAMKRKGLDLSMHRSRNITRELVRDNDLILTMERNHKEALRIEVPEYAAKIMLLSEIVSQNYEIRDPVGGLASDYDATADELESLLVEGFDWILSQVEARP